MSDDSSAEGTLSRDISNVTVSSESSNTEPQKSTADSESDDVTLDQSKYESDKFLSDSEEESLHDDVSDHVDSPNDDVIDHADTPNGDVSGHVDTPNGDVSNHVDSPNDDVNSQNKNEVEAREEQEKLFEKEDTTLSSTNSDTKRQLSRESTVLSKTTDLSESSSDFSRENTKLSTEDVIVSSRENTNISKSINDSDSNAASYSEEVKIVTTTPSVEDEVTREKTDISTTSYSTTSSSESDLKYSDDNADYSRQSSALDMSNDSEDELKRLEKEDSVLIEKDGKFELVSPDELKSEYRDLLGLPEEKPRKKPSSAKVSSKRTKVEVPNRPSHSSLSTSPYAHIQSSYGMSEQQKEMKKRRAALIKLRKEEEKERKKEEEEQKKIAADKCFKQWLSDKTSHTKEHQKLKKAASDTNQSQERLENAQRAYDAWLQEKREQMREEKFYEKMRLEDEAQAYVIRSRENCEKAFDEWLRRKNIERREAASAKPDRTKFTAGNGRKKKLVQVKLVSAQQQKQKPAIRF